MASSHCRFVDEGRDLMSESTISVTIAVVELSLEEGFVGEGSASYGIN